jgi:hypothetical protein
MEARKPGDPDPPERLARQELDRFLLSKELKMLNLLNIEPGQKLQMKDGSTVEVVENIGDGIWLKAKLPEGDEDLVFCEDIASVAPSGS